MGGRASGEAFTIFLTPRSLKCVHEIILISAPYGCHTNNKTMTEKIRDQMEEKTLDYMAWIGKMMLIIIGLLVILQFAFVNYGGG